MENKGYPKRKKTNQAQNIAQNMAENFSAPDETDVLGSWTGTGFDEDEPVQDADDL